MSILYRNLKCIVTAFALLMPISSAAVAQTPDETDETVLLEQLAGADPAAALRLDRQLQALWAKSGSASMDLLLRRGRDAMERGDTREALEHLTALTDHAPDFAEGWHARASAFFEAERFGPALDDIQTALELNPTNYNAIFGLGTMMETFGDPDRAWFAYERVLELHPHHPHAGTAMQRLEPRISGRDI